MAPLAKYRILTGPLGPDVIEVNGEDVTARVNSATLQTAPGHPTLLLLRHLSTEGEITGEGIVNVVEDEPEVDAAEIVTGFLNTVDPQALSKRVMANADFGQKDAIQVAMDLLMEMARDY